MGYPSMKAVGKAARIKEYALFRFSLVLMALPLPNACPGAYSGGVKGVHSTRGVCDWCRLA
ncbi:hypothetical protein HEQ60_08115 [Haematospirillum sp. H1815]|uniref:hypothetical protein n=1 Tax=Haematospirillum sp. H1815 TaxID=2723108 RepID=UPI0014387D21|nr:hypothetical protein [Haematospirillum sp. H1815]NKD77723.1 hypothetical protein [Haematospirillum sp. H1815]